MKVNVNFIIFVSQLVKHESSRFKVFYVKAGFGTCELLEQQSSYILLFGKTHYKLRCATYVLIYQEQKKKEINEQIAQMSLTLFVSMYTFYCICTYK